MKKWIALILIIALGGGAWWYFKRSGGSKVEYQTVKLALGDMTQMVTATGTLNPVLNVQVGSQISGNIQKLNADFNTKVTAGQMVAQLDPAVYQAIVHQVEGDLANARAGLELAQLTAKRKQDLVAQKAAAQADLDTALGALHQAEATVQVKQANLEKAKVDLDHCTIYSPIDGIVISRSVDVGQTVAAAMNAPVLFTIANDLAKMQIDSNVAEADVGNVELDQTVDFTVDAFPFRTFHGKVIQVRNAATTVQNVVTYNVVIAVNNEDLKLKPGMTANVSIVIAQRENVLKLPNAATRVRMPEGIATPVPATPAQAAAGAPGERRKGGGGRREGGRGGARSVWVMPSEGGTPTSVPVKLGINDGISTEVLEGLKEGDLIVIGVESSDGPKAAAPANPFGGGPRRF
jgi:HlyD family secretion protein